MLAWSLSIIAKQIPHFLTSNNKNVQTIVAETLVSHYAPIIT